MSRILLIEDNKDLAFGLQSNLEIEGYTVTTAATGSLGVEKANYFKPDLVILDLMLPGMDGFEVATLVRHDERLKDVPIIMITSRTGQKHKDRALSIGVNGYLGKPFQEHDLLENIEKYLN